MCALLSATSLTSWPIPGQSEGFGKISVNSARSHAGSRPERTRPPAGRHTSFTVDGFPIYGPYECVDVGCSSVQKMLSSWDKPGQAGTTGCASSAVCSTPADRGDQRGRCEFNNFRRYPGSGVLGRSLSVVGTASPVDNIAEPVTLGAHFCVAPDRKRRTTSPACRYSRRVDRYSPGRQRISEASAWNVSATKSVLVVNIR
jgi:hypothetical protein